MSELRNRIIELERLLKPCPVPWGKIYDTIKAMDKCIPFAPNNRIEDFDAYFVEKNGTREAFIHRKTVQYEGYNLKRKE